MANYQDTNTQAPIRVGVFLVGGETELLDIAPVDMLHTIDSRSVRQYPESDVPPALKADAKNFEFIWVSERGPEGNAHLTSGAKVQPSHSFQDCPDLDIVILGAHNFEYRPSESELAFIRKVWTSCSSFITICGGMMVPLKAGILDGKTATAPRFRLEELRRTAPNTNWVEKRWVRDGKLWTSSTFLNGTDLMHAFIKATWGGEEGGLIDRIARECAFPERDVDFKDDQSRS